MNRQAMLHTWGARTTAELRAASFLAAAKVDGLKPALHSAALNKRQRVAHALLEQKVGRLHVAVHQARRMAGRHYL